MADKRWRALRIASTQRLGRFEKIDVDGKNLQRLFEEENVEDGGGAGKDADAGVTASTTMASDGAATTTLAEAESRAPGSVPEQPGPLDDRAGHTESTMPESAVK
jgi:hypothetical protein